MLLNTVALPKSILVLVVSTGLLAAGCRASVGDPAPSNGSGQPASKQVGKAMIDEKIPINKRFGSLDEYLAHLELTQGPVDGPWYKQVGPDMYELQTGNLKLDQADGVEQKRLFTRQELEKKFGFSN